MKRMQTGEDESQLVNWCFEPSQPLGIISGLKETFIKRYTVERTNKAELRPQEQSEKRRRQKQTQEQNKKECTSSDGLHQTQTVTSPPRQGEPTGTENERERVREME